METKKPNWYVRILIILLCIFIGGLIYFNFFWTCPPAQISTGLLVLVAFLTVLVLSEAFDNFSIAKLISLSKTVKETDNKNQELKKENSDLRNQIVSISTSISQKQINSTFVLTDELAKMLSVRQAEEPEKQQKQKETEEEAEQVTTLTSANSEPQTQEPPPRRLINFRRYEEIALAKFLASEGLSQLPIISDAKFTDQFQQIDPISEYSPIFDGYIKTIDTEIFVDMRMKNRNMMMLRERLYLMLSKLNYYRNIKRVNAYLFLVLILKPEEEQYESVLDRIKKEFEPAITNGLLRIREIEITTEENRQVINEQ
jgi:hypothetical protein